MAQSIVFNNATYIIPDVGESSWGQNLTNYFVAIPQGAYQLSGGTAPLTADLSFGSSFGLFAKYLTSVTSTPATAGMLRLARADVIDWRNQANGGNLALGVDSSDNLTFNGNIISGSGAGPVTSIAGTANQITASAATGAITLSTPVTFIAPGSIAATTTLAGTAATLSATTNQIVLGTTNTTTLSSTAPAASRVYTIPDAGGAAHVVLDAGNYTIAGTWNFSNSITLASSKAVVFTDNGTSTVTLKATNSTTSWTLNLPTNDGNSNQFLQTDGSGNTTWADGGAGTVSSGTAGNLSLYPATAAAVSDTYVQNSQNIKISIAAQASRSQPLVVTIPNPGNAVTAADVVLTVGAQTITGAKTFASSTLLLQEVSSTDVITIAVAALAAGRTYTFPDAGGAAEIVMNAGNQTIAGVKTFSGGAGGITMSGSTIAMGANKITGLANGTASTDAMAFGQRQVIQTVIATATGAANTTGSTFGASGFAVTITPTSASSRILLFFSTCLFTTTATNFAYITFARGSTNLGGAEGFALAAVGAANLSTGCAITYIDSPATTSATTYNIYERNSNNINSAGFGSANLTSVFIAMEIV